MEIFLVSFLPRFCAKCGESTDMGKYAMHDFLAKSSFSCTCGARYQYVEADKLLKTAEASGGDMGVHVQRQL